MEMRALGPQSVSSFLKIALDVVYIGAVGVAAVVGPMIIALLIATPFSHSPMQVKLGGEIWVSPFSNTTVIALLIGVETYVVCLVVVLNRIRLIVETLVMGDPFRPENVGRLRWIGTGLIVLEFATDGLRWLLAHVPQSHPTPRAGESWFNPTAWFAVLVVFVLAEVFREGARLRQEAELTI
jgi:Protein of unknown function (DUF2975)